MLMPRSIRWLSILTASISGLVILVVGIAIIAISHREIEAQIDHRIEIEMDALLSYRTRHSIAELAELVEERDAARPANIGYLADDNGRGRSMLYGLYAPDGKHLAGSLTGKPPPNGWEEFLRFRRPNGKRGFAQALSRRLDDGSQLVVAGDRGALRQSDRRILFVVLVGVGVILLVGTISTIAFGRLIQRRLLLISTTAQGIMEGDYSRRVPLDGSGGEFRRISLILNTMFDRIEVLMQSLRQISSDIAHDMRTPITRVRQDMEAFMLKAPDADTAGKLERMIADLDGLLDLFSGLLGVSEVQGFAARKRFVPLALADVVNDVVEAYRPAFDDEHRALRANLEPVTISGDAQLIQRAIANLLENSLVHAGNGADVDVTLVAEAGAANLTVSDNGQGVGAGDEARIFERLVRLDSARSKPGHGLGLSMVQAIVQAHRGTIAVIPSEGGLRIGIQLPRL